MPRSKRVLIEKDDIPKKSQRGSHNNSVKTLKNDKFKTSSFKNEKKIWPDSSDSSSSEEYIPVEASDSSSDESPDSISEKSIDEEIDLEEDSEESLEKEISYFDLDPKPLIDIVTKRLKNHFPDLEEKDLNTAVKKALKKADQELIEDYCGVIPKDSFWKKDLNKEEIETLEPDLKKIRENISLNIPTIPKILKTDLSWTEKEKAIQLYDILQNTEPFTAEYLALSRRINDIIIPRGIKLNKSEEEQLLYLQEKIQIETPSIEKIMTAFLTESDKIRALKLYDSLNQSRFYTEEYFEIQRRINNILETQLESQEEVQRIENEEKKLKNIKHNFHADLKRKIFDLDADSSIKGRLYEMYCDMVSRGSDDSRYSDLRDKILLAIKLPYRTIIMPNYSTNTPEEIRVYCRNVYHKLNQDIYGMREAKEKVIQIVNDRIYNPRSRAFLALKGKPGVGKTKLAKTIANAVGLPFEKISLGGTIDSTIFKGSDNVWSGASPSMLLQILSKVKCSNAVILLDEIDKLSTSEKGLEVQHALLHILDPSQNKEFQDAYLNEFSHDISNIWFILAMNNDKLDPALKDRLNIIEIPSYTKEEMVQIVLNHTLYDALSDKGIHKDDISITESAVLKLINILDSEIELAGMRPIERAINDIISKLNLLRSLHGSDDIPLTFNLKDFRGFPYVITDKNISQLYNNSSHKNHDLSYFL
jgi:ATP-dependent Lon protease